jgi:hypothetical protein
MRLQGTEYSTASVTEQKAEMPTARTTVMIRSNMAGPSCMAGERRLKASVGRGGVVAHGFVHHHI